MTGRYSALIAGILALTMFVLPSAAAQDDGATRAPQGGMRAKTPAGSVADQVQAVKDTDRKLEVRLGARYLRVFHFRDYRYWPEDDRQSFSGDEPLQLGGMSVDNRIFLFATNPSSEPAKVRFQAFGAAGNLLHEVDRVMNPGFSDTMLKFSLDKTTSIRPELFILTSNKPILAFGWASRDEEESLHIFEGEDTSRSKLGLAMTELTPREFDCQEVYGNQEYAWLCSRPTAKAVKS